MKIVFWETFLYLANLESIIAKVFFKLYKKRQM